MDNSTGWKSINIDATIKKMFQLYKEQPVLFGGLVLVVGIPYFLIVVFVFGPYLPPWLNLIFTLLITVFAFLLYIGSTVHAAHLLTSGKKADFVTCIQFALSKFLEGIILFFRILWYTWAWILIVLMIIIGFTSAAMMGNVAESFAATDSAYAQSEIDFSDFEGMEGLEDFDFDAYGDFDFDTSGSMDFGSMGRSYGNYGTPNIIQMLIGGGFLFVILGLVFIVLSVLVLIRAVRTIYAYFALFSDEKIKSKEALAESIKLAKGNWWTILGFVMVIGIILNLISYAILIVVALLASIIQNSAVSMALMMIMYILVFPLSALFYYTFYHNMKKVS